MSFVNFDRSRVEGSHSHSSHAGAVIRRRDLMLLYCAETIPPGPKNDSGTQDPNSQLHRCKYSLPEEGVVNIREAPQTATGIQK